MFRVEPITAPLPGLALIDASAQSRVEIAPDRGGMVTRFRVGARDVLFMDGATLVDRSKNVRGGIPVLFPIAGKLPNESYARDGKTYALKQHGFARNVAWSVEAQRADGDARVTLALRSSEATRAQFPWDFEVRFTYALAGATLTIAQAFENRSRTAMPLHAGFHPYFRVPDAEKRSARLATDATLAFDNTRGVREPFAGIDFTRPELDLHLLDHRSRPTELRLGDGSAVVIDASADYRVCVLWTLAGKDFVCVEPWTAPGNVLNTGEGLLEIAPGATHEMRVAIRAS